MFEALVITLREGVEAALVLAIALSLLSRQNRLHLRAPLFVGAATALLASIGVAWFAGRVTWNEELAEGIAMLVAAALVLGLVWWMWWAAPRMRQEIERGITRATESSAGAWFGVFLFGFVMLFREGVETAIFLTAAGFNSEGLRLWIGATIGIALAAAFGVFFVRGAIRLPLKPFFSITSAVLLLFAAQLLVGGLHELSEAEVLPSSKSEMALIGPLVKNELLLFTLTVALAAGWLVWGVAAPAQSARPSPIAASGPELRLERARAARESSRRRWTGLVALLVVGFLATAFVLNSKMPDKAPATLLVAEAGAVRFDSTPLADRQLHFYEVAVPGGSVRFFAVRVDGQIRTCLDACEICGDKGYFQEGGTVVCRNCTSPIVIRTLGRTGGCNPIPLPHRTEGAMLAVDEAELRAALPKLGGR